MELVELKVNVPKEMQDISIFLQGVVADVKAKKPVAEILAGSLAGLMTAVTGYEKLGEEVKSAEAGDCIALLGSGVFKALKG